MLFITHYAILYLVMSQFNKKLDEVQKLLKDKERIDKRLKELLQASDNTTTLPRGFSMQSEVLKLIEGASAQGISAQEILQAIEKQYGMEIDRKKVASALAYLKNGKKQIEKLGRGIYRLKTVGDAVSSA